MHSHLHLSSLQRSLLLQTLQLNLHSHLHVSCHSMYFVLLVPDIRLNTLTFKIFYNIRNTQFCAWVINIVTTPLHLLVLILRRKYTESSPLTLTICGLTLHSWLFIEIQRNIFTLVRVNKHGNPVKKHLLINPSILLYYFILYHQIIVNL